MTESFDIELFKTRTEVIRQTVGQLVKDFAMFGMDLHFTGNTEMAYPEMFHQLSDHIGRLLESDYQKLSSLLYQIDLSENQIRQALDEHPDITMPDVITELVIHRELKKVLFRNYFKNNKSEL